MAWYALYKWLIPWSKRPYTNRIIEYKKYLAQEKFNNLSEDEKEKYLKEVEIEKRKNEILKKKSLFTFLRLYEIMLGEREY